MYCGRDDVAAPMTSCDRAPAVCAINVATALPLVTPSSDSALRRERVFCADIVTPPVNSTNMYIWSSSTVFYRCAWLLHYHRLYHIEVRVRALYCRIAPL